MVAIVTGAGLGTERSSANVLGSRGQLGSAGLGQGNELVTINAANGNLIISHQDEVLIGRGPDGVVTRTYNSQGLFNDDNGDNWPLGIQRRIYSVSGTLYRTDWDGSETAFVWDASRSAYVSKEGAGAYDTLLYDGANWVWKDGDTGVTELYSPAYNNRIVSQVDRDGNATSYAYASETGNLLSVTTADGGVTTLNWSGNNLIGCKAIWRRLADPRKCAGESVEFPATSFQGSIRGRCSHGIKGSHSESSSFNV